MLAAIGKSGYPLQSRTAVVLRDHFQIVVEEWGYLDHDSGDSRSMDLFAQSCLGGIDGLQMHLAILVECKKSVHPHVFFGTAVDRKPASFPLITGLPIVRIANETGSVSSQPPIGDILGLSDSEFITPGPPICSSFAKAELKGKNVDLSGESPFSSVILPLSKAIDHAKSLSTTGDSDRKLFPTIILGICVMDSPMIVVTGPETASDPVLMPWVRVPRDSFRLVGGYVGSEPRSKFYSHTVDFVHFDYLSTYFSSHIQSLRDLFYERCISQETILRRGAIAKFVDDWGWQELRPQ